MGKWVNEGGGRREKEVGGWMGGWEDEGGGRKK